jgi:hypothetical protein
MIGHLKEKDVKEFNNWFQQEEEEMRKIYNDIILSVDFPNKKKADNAMGTYGKKSIPFIQELYDMETDEHVKKLYARHYDSN